MHASGLLPDCTLNGGPVPSIHQYLTDCRATVESIDKRKARQEITEVQKWDEIKSLMMNHNRLMDLSCCSPGNLPERLREFLSPGDIEGANGKAVAERGEIHSAHQNMHVEVNIDKYIKWFAAKSWFRWYAEKDKYMSSTEDNRSKVKQRVLHLVAAMWDLSGKKDLLGDTLQKAAYPYVSENVMPSRLLQVYREYGYNAQDN